MTDQELIALKERVAALDRLFTAQLSAQDEKVQLALSSAEKAITKAEIATEKRFEGVNEFRSALSDQASTFATRAVVDTQLEALRDRVGDLSGQVSRLLIALLLTVVGALISTIVYIVTR